MRLSVTQHRTGLWNINILHVWFSQYLMNSEISFLFLAVFIIFMIPVRTEDPLCLAYC